MHNMTGITTAVPVWSFRSMAMSSVADEDVIQDDGASGMVTLWKRAGGAVLLTVAASDPVEPVRGIPASARKAITTDPRRILEQRNIRAGTCDDLTGRDPAHAWKPEL